MKTIQMADSLLSNDKVLSALLDYIEILKDKASVCAAVDPIIDSESEDVEAPEVFGASQKRLKSVAQLAANAFSAYQAYIRSGSNTQPGGLEEAARLQAEYIKYRDLLAKLEKQGLAVPELDAEEGSEVFGASQKRLKSVAQLAANAYAAYNAFVRSGSAAKPGGLAEAARLQGIYIKYRDQLAKLEKQGLAIPE